jgi:SAM-dependent methyltransferase
MPTVEENKSAWNELYEWSDEGEEWSAAWGGSENQWYFSLLPRLRDYLSKAEIGVEIAPGFGRWTQYLVPHFDKLHLVDLSKRCIDASKVRFEGCSNLEFHVNNGFDLSMISSNSVDFVFSFDSLVHVNSDVIDSYVLEIDRILKPEGVAFIHHSNLGSFANRINLLKRIRGRRYLINWGLLDDYQSGFRSKDVSAETVRARAEQVGINCFSQELINWGTRSCIDCLTLLRKTNELKPTSIYRNSRYMAEAAYVKALGRHYKNIG